MISSLYARFLVLMVGGLISSFLLSNYLWYTVLESKRLAQGREMARDMAFSVGSTMEFIRAYPTEYRHIILNQFRDMGGSRYLVSINKKFINIDPFIDSDLKREFIDNFLAAIEEKLGQRLEGLSVEFADPTELRVYKNDIRLVDLPPRWAQNTLIREPESAPVLVAQVLVGEGEWLYLAGLLSDPYYLNESRYLGADQLLFLSIMLVVLLAISWVLVRWLTRPLVKLSRAARRLGTDIEYDIRSLQIEGTREVRETAMAFNFMQERVVRFIEDRERMFSAISHDLKTPITRLRLRSELMDDSDTKRKMIGDLEELESMARGALDLGKSTDIHEGMHAININQLMRTFKDEYKLMGAEIEIRGIAKRPYFGKPLALKRCISNLINNAVFYGKSLRLDVVDSRAEMKIYIVDQGPGIPEEQLDKVFEPYVRLEGSRNRNTGGAGLGLSIARNIAHAHGGRLTLRNRIGSGLEAAVILPRI
ncbi:ATP-binding protein [Reinekea forsetii]|uniref:histidine kinase n=1 Tax=Reinekea forsetii TaxID=1336806 RepID=A0A2K8KTN6_9GAMM|nr:ATP-binding protein [Reinekea forsetii]ATX77982.1 signal transduction sensor histidine kinase [Reinekea forsetii]